MPISDWAPAVADVGAVLRARTKDTNGNELGTFTPNTRPTDAQVTSLIDTAAGDLASVVGSDLPEVTWPLAGSVTSIGAAMLVELSYFPEQVATGRSPYDQLAALYEQRLGRLKGAVIEAGGDVPDEAGARPPAYHFGDVAIIGRDTAW